MGREGETGNKARSGAHSREPEPTCLNIMTQAKVGRLAHRATQAPLLQFFKGVMGSAAEQDFHIDYIF